MKLKSIKIKNMSNLQDLLGILFKIPSIHLNWKKKLSIKNFVKFKKIITLKNQKIPT